MFYRYFVGASYIRPIFIVYSSYVEPLKRVVFIGLSGGEAGGNGEAGGRREC